MSRDWEHRYVDIDGTSAHYLQAGQGEETLLLIHGGIVWSCAELVYGPVLGQLAKSLRVIAVDVVGFGETPARDEADFLPKSQGEFLRRFLERLGGRVHVAGNSMGGWLATYLALEAPDLIKTLTIINSGSLVVANRPDDGEDRYDPRWAVPARPPTIEDIREEFRAFYLQDRCITEERVELAHRYANTHYAAAVERQRAQGMNSVERNRNLHYRGSAISESAAGLRLPVLITWSRENRGAAPEKALPLFQSLHDVELHVLVGAGHHVQLEHPERWADVVRGFVALHGART